MYTDAYLAKFVLPEDLMQALKNSNCLCYPETKEQLIEKLESFRGIPQELDLPSAPKQFIRYMEEDNRPQVQLDVEYERGMGISIGRIREDSIYDFKFVGLSHNTVRGAAGGAILCAETLKAKGYIQAK